MDLTQEMRERLGKADDRLTALMGRLEGLRSIEEEHAEAGRNVGELAAQARAASEALARAADSLRAASDVMAQSDPARLVAAVDDLRANVERDVAGVARQVEEAAERASRETGSGNARVIQEFQAEIGALGPLSDRVGKVEETLGELLAALSRRRGPLKRVARRLGQTG